MFLSKFSEYSGDDSKQPSENYGIKIDKKFMIELTKGFTSFTKDIRDSCKALHFSLKWSIAEILRAIDKLASDEYPNLFIFMVQANLESTEENQSYCSEKLVQLQTKLLKFRETGPIIFQLTFCKDKVTKIFYKTECSNQFCSINKSDEFYNFLSLFESFSNGKSEEIQVLNALSTVANRSLAIRLLQTVKLSKNFSNQLVLNAATKTELLSALDEPFESEGTILGIRAQKYIPKLIKDYHDPKIISSVLLSAIINKKDEIFNYLIFFLTHLIQQLPFDHQVRVSTAAFNSNQLDALCNLLDIVDFPFPKDFEIDSVNDHKKLRAIIKERVDFHAAIHAKDFIKFDEFVNTHQDLKFVYNPSNTTALSQAVNVKNLESFYYLKSLGFGEEKCDKIFNQLSIEEKKLATKLAAEQRRKNIIKSLPNVHRTVLKMSIDSRIHFERINKERETEYHKIIMEWFTDIQKVAPEMLNVAASCVNLNIIFDFESDVVENASLTGSYASGSTFPHLNCIFIGSKLSDTSGNSTKQKIKGVIAHEICHLVMQLVYGNESKPYFKDKPDVKEEFDKIVDLIGKWLKAMDDHDDECNGIISSVYELYEPKLFHVELIVRAVQILTAFDDNEGMLIYLQDIYKILFDFWLKQIIPDLQNYLLKDQRVVKLNGLLGCLQNNLQTKIKINPVIDVKKLTDGKITIVTTNCPKLLFNDICNQLKDLLKVLMDSKNFFITSENLKNDEIWIELNQICVNNQELNIFIDCTKNVPSFLENIFLIKLHSFIFVVSNETQYQKLVKICKKKKVRIETELKIFFNWSDLTTESQKELLKSKISFQNSQVSLDNLLKNVHTQPQDLFHIIDTQLLNFIIENEKISVNIKSHDGLNKKDLDFVYQSRRFVKRKVYKKNSDAQTVFYSNQYFGLPIMYQDELLREVKGQRYVLISDKAGNGKSWVMKKIASSLMQQNQTSWVTYVDLKQYTEQYEQQMVQGSELEFMSFMVERILKPQQQFENQIFQKLYKEGKVIIMFDGFDEIAPTYAKFVSALAHTFQWNNGNQLWIATRDFFEVDLQQNLKLVAKYSLEEMEEEKGIEMIVKSWFLKDLKEDQNEPKSKKVFNKFIKSSPVYQRYKQKAYQLVKKTKPFRRNSIGLPQLFKMIADTYKDKDAVEDLEGSVIFDEFIKHLYTQWSQNKGPIRKKANTESQKFEFKFNDLHQFYAISGLFPKSAEILFKDYNRKEWSATEIIACGILTIFNEKVYFNHETLCEYFSAEYLARELKKLTIKEEVLKIFIEVLNKENFKIIRMFLIDMICDFSSLMKIAEKLQHHIEIFSIMKFLTESLTKSIDLNSQNFQQYLNFIEKILTINELSDLLSKCNSEKQNVVQISIRPKNTKNFEILWIEMENFLGSENFKEFIKLHDKVDQNNILHCIASKEHIDLHEVLWRLLLNTFDNKEELKNFILRENIRGYNFLHWLIYCNQNVAVIELTFEYLKTIFCQTQCEEIVLSKNICQSNLLQVAAYSSECVQVHKFLWEFFKNYRETIFLEMIKETDMSKRNTLHLAARNTKGIIFRFLINSLEKVASRDEIRKMLKNKCIFKRNLLQTAVCNSWYKETSIHKAIWKAIRTYFDKSEALFFVINVDTCGNNLLFNAFTGLNCTNKVLIISFQNIKNILNCEEMKNYMTWKNNRGDNFEQHSRRGFCLPEHLFQKITLSYDQCVGNQYGTEFEIDSNEVTFNEVQGT